MLPERWQEVNKIFSLALLRTAAAARPAYLATVCGGDATLRAAVEAAAGSTSPQLAVPLSWEEKNALAGTVIGAYRLEREIGRGGARMPRRSRDDAALAILNRAVVN